MYDGALTNGHLRAVARLALRAHGLRVPTDGQPRFERAPAPNAHGEAESLARVRSIADSLAELASDAHSGAPNAVLMRHGPAPGELRDVDLYAVIDAGAGELAALVASSTTGEWRELMLRETFYRLGWPLVESQAEGIPSVAVLETSRAQLQRATDALHEEAERGFAQSGHPLRFPRGRRGETRHETHTATLLFRAVTLDALLDARAAGLAVCDRVLSHEGMALLKSKHPGVRGGWSYFETVPELPPDADDLGQVLQALARLGGPDLASTCDEPLELALDASRAAGGFPTWILDPALPGHLDRLMSAYVSVIGGTGVHPEVVANLLVGLLYYDPARFAPHLRRGVGYLERTQDPGGWWESRWYAGRFYGTFKAAAVLGRLVPGSEAVRRAQAFIVSSHREDGGWGDDTSDPLATSHALLAYACLGGTGHRARAAAELLLSQQRGDGTWPPNPWVQFPTLDGLQSYSSSAMSTAFALKACLASAAGEQSSRAASGILDSRSAQALAAGADTTPWN